MRFFHIIYLVFFGTLILKSQDSICFRNNTIVAANIELVTQETVSYKLANSASRVNYIVNKDDIQKIKYKNGFTEEFKITPIEEKVKYISVKDIHTSIDYKTVAKNTKELSLFIDERNSLNNKPELYKLANDIYKCKEHRHSMGICATVFGIFTGASTIVFGLDYLITFGNPNKEAVYPPIGFATLSLGSLVGNAIFANKLRAKRFKFVDLYNQ